MIVDKKHVSCFAMFDSRFCELQNNTSSFGPIDRTVLWLQLIVRIVESVIAQIFGISRIFGTAPIVRIRLPCSPHPWGLRVTIHREKNLGHNAVQRARTGFLLALTL